MKAKTLVQFLLVWLLPLASYACFNPTVQESDQVWALMLLNGESQDGCFNEAKFNRVTEEIGLVRAQNSEIANVAKFDPRSFANLLQQFGVVAGFLKKNLTDAEREAAFQKIEFLASEFGPSSFSRRQYDQDLWMFSVKFDTLRDTYAITRFLGKNAGDEILEFDTFFGFGDSDQILKLEWSNGNRSYVFRDTSHEPDCPSGCAGDWYYYDVEGSATTLVKSSVGMGYGAPSFWGVPNRFNLVSFGDYENLKEKALHGLWWERLHALAGVSDFLSYDSCTYGEDCGSSIIEDILSHRAEWVAILESAKLNDPDPQVRHRLSVHRPYIPDAEYPFVHQR